MTPKQYTLACECKFTINFIGNDGPYNIQHIDSPTGEVTTFVFCSDEKCNHDNQHIIRSGVNRMVTLCTLRKEVIEVEM